MRFLRFFALPIVVALGCWIVLAIPLVAQIADGERRLVMNVGGKPAEIWYFGNFALDTSANPSITRAVVMVHGAGRNAGGYYSYTLSAAQKAKREASTIVIGLHFPMERDLDSLKMGDSVLYWTNVGWKQGDESVQSEKRPRKIACGELSSFAVLDSVVMRLADKKRFPKLTTVVLAGHSAGGQYMQRYTAGSQITSAVQAYSKQKKVANPTFRFIISNPSSYAYLDDKRPVFGDFSVPPKTFARPTDTSDAGDFNEYRYGLEKLNPYMTATGKERIRRQFLEREVCYLMGGADTLQSQNNLDTSRSARLQGRFRLERGRAFHSYILNHAPSLVLTKRQKLPLTKNIRHTIEVVPDVGHDGKKMFTSEVALRQIFK
ncbi:MAG: hypothetical protein ACOVSW_10350 [Candidatus Kapaibacteriota bacterium]